MTTTLTIGIVSATIIVIALVVYILLAEQRKSKTKISFKEGLDLTELPIATFYSNKTKLHFLLDTGSNISYIDKGVLHRVNCKSLNKKSSTIGVEGSGVESDHYEVVIGYKNNTFTEEFGAIDFRTTFDAIEKESGIRLHGILGSKFFEKYRYILDFKELTAYR